MGIGKVGGASESNSGMMRSIRSLVCKLKVSLDVHSNVLSELHSVAEKEKQELLFVESKLIPEKDKAKRLLYLFQCDLLPGISGQILSSKGARDSSTC